MENKEVKQDRYFSDKKSTQSKTDFLCENICLQITTEKNTLDLKTPKNRIETKDLNSFPPLPSQEKIMKEKNSGVNRRGSKPHFREQLLEFGAKNLKDEELIALLLRTGYAKKSVISLANDVLRVLDKSDISNVRENLSIVEGIGETKLCTVLAALELGRRYFCFQDSKITSPKALVPYLLHYAYRKQETFICVSLSGANEVIAIRVVTVGTLNRTIVHPREVFADPITDRAASIIIAHNHPSGNLVPSDEDILLTQRLVSAGEILGIAILDHLILNASGEFFSMMEKGLIP
ncbi:MAG: DNA repair protein RadC [Treponemataceae bacterium]